MKDIVDGIRVPYIFHMCWTANRDEKLKYLKGMNYWYLKEGCELRDVLSNSKSSEFLKNCMQV